jgi:hypothetical protein
MPQMRVATSVAAGATTNLLAGQQYEFMPGNMAIAIGLTVPAASAGALFADVYAGPTLLIAAMPIPGETAAGRGPIADQDYVLRERLRAGTRLSINVRNPTGGAVVVTASVLLQVA